MQADSLKRLVSRGNANKETCAYLVVNTACKGDKPPRKADELIYFQAMLTVCSVSRLTKIFS